MGCCGSKSDPPPAQETGTVYAFISANIITVSPQGPTDAIQGVLDSAKAGDLVPNDSGKLPLLALALDNDKWFRCLIALCDQDKLDPGVEWTVDRRKKSIGAELYGKNTDLHELWSEAKNEWDQRRRNMVTNNVPPPTGSDGWFKEFEPEAIALGLVVATAGAATAVLFAGVSVSAMPLVAVGKAIWQAIRDWNNGFNANKPTPELQKLFDESKGVLKSMLTQLDARMEKAEKAARTNPEEERDGYDGEKKRVERLQVLLERDGKSMVRISQSTDRPEIKEEKMTKMLRGLHKFERNLYNDGILKEVVAKLDNIQDQLDDSKNGAPSLGSVDTSERKSSEPGIAAI